jgi:hypothetical protein
VFLRLRQEIRAVLRRGDEELTYPFLPNRQTTLSALDKIPGEGNPRPPLVRNGKILTDKAKLRLRRDSQPVHCLRSATAQLD